MTQHAQDAPETHVPKWFADFAVKNADEHAALAQRISDSHIALAKEIANNSREIADVRAEIARQFVSQTRWTAILFISALTIAVSVLSALIILVN